MKGEMLNSGERMVVLYYPEVHSKPSETPCPFSLCFIKKDNSDLVKHMYVKLSKKNVMETLFLES